MVELGKINRPDAENFSGKRKLYCVANIFTPEDAPDDYRELVSKYWDEVVSQVGKIEAAGKVKKIFTEIVLDSGEPAFEILGRVNEKLSALVKQRIEDGAVLVPVESQDLLGPYTDWSNCLRVVYTREVFTKVFSFFNEISGKRLGHIMDVIQKNLLEAESGLLIMKDEDRVKLQFPNDIEIFLITPPSYDDIIRWLRGRMLKKEEQ